MVARQLAILAAYATANELAFEVLYRDHLSARFVHYLSRIGLPGLSS
jgi:hypothetical protein